MSSHRTLSAKDERLEMIARNHEMNFLLLLRRIDLNKTHWRWAQHPYVLPNNLDAFRWSIPFVLEKVTDLIWVVLKYCTDENDPRSSRRRNIIEKVRRRQKRKRKVSRQIFRFRFVFRSFSITLRCRKKIFRRRKNRIAKRENFVFLCFVFRVELNFQWKEKKKFSRVVFLSKDFLVRADRKAPKNLHQAKFCSTFDASSVAWERRVDHRIWSPGEKTSRFSSCRDEKQKRTWHLESWSKNCSFSGESRAFFDLSDWSTFVTIWSSWALLPDKQK